MKKLLLLGTMAMALTLTASQTAKAAEQASCGTLRVGDVGWSDNTAINALTFLNVASALGYKSDIKTLASPVIAKSLSTKDLDVFLDYWSPAADSLFGPVVKNKTVEVIRNNVEGAKYTFATTKTAYDAGLKNIKDLPKFKDKLGGKVYGIEPGNEGNDHFRAAFKKYGIEGFTVVESSEAGMLSQVERNKDGYVVFLGWAPHWMGYLYKMEYLDGGDEWFGKNGGYTNIKTLVRAGLKQDCPNVYKFLSNVKFTLPMENEVMYKIGKEKKDPKKAAAEYLKKNPDVLNAWLAGVTTKDGGDAVAAVKKSLGM